MSQFHDSGYRSYLAAAALAENRLVVISADNTVNYASAAGTAATGIIGVTVSSTTAAAQAIKVKQLTGPGTVMVKAASGFTPAAGNLVQAAANGEGALRTGTNTVVGVVVKAAADGGVFEMVPSYQSPG